MKSLKYIMVLNVFILCWKLQYLDYLNMLEQ